jgi:3-methyl-2-oxobutanoate hydroxymethyltransferase
MLVLELVPSALAREITQAHPEMMTIGIGAGAGTTGQVLVLHDLLGLTSGKRPRFVRDFTREPAAPPMRRACRWRRPCAATSST